MEKYKKSKLKKGETRTTNLTFIVQDGSSWAINRTDMPAEWIERIENMLLELCNELDKSK